MRPVSVRYLALLAGVFFCSTSVIFIRWSETGPIWLSAWRLLAATVLLWPFFSKARRDHPGRFDRRILKRTVWPAVLLAAHFIAWIAGARLTLAANASIIVNLVPAVMPFLLFWLATERVSRWEIVGSGLALSGVMVLGVVDYRLDPVLFKGDLICFLAMLFYAVYLVFARLNRDFASIWFYLVPVYGLAGLICLVVAIFNTLGRTLFFAVSGVGWQVTQWEWEIMMALGLAIIPTIMGHSLLNWSLQHLRGQTVSLVNLGQFISAGLLGYLLLGDIPDPLFVPVSALLVCGAALAIWGNRHDSA